MSKEHAFTHHYAQTLSFEWYTFCISYCTAYLSILEVHNILIVTFYRLIKLILKLALTRF